jgi:hypothetical protein
MSSSVYFGAEIISTLAKANIPEDFGNGSPRDLSCLPELLKLTKQPSTIHPIMGAFFLFYHG